MQAQPYTHTISFYKEVRGLGWTFDSFRTTTDALQTHVRKLHAKQVAGTVRLIDVRRV